MDAFPQKTGMPRRFLYICALIVGLLLTLAADVWIAYWPDSAYACIWLLIFSAGVIVAVPCWKYPWIGYTAVGVSALHFIALYIGVEADSQTFFGGKMVSMIAALLWAVVGSGLLITTILGALTRHLTRRGDDRRET